MLKVIHLLHKNKKSLPSLSKPLNHQTHSLMTFTVTNKFGQLGYWNYHKVATMYKNVILKAA